MKKLLSLLLIIGGALSASAYSFSTELPSGQTIYLTITDGYNVKVVAPATMSWNGIPKPSGRMEIPSHISHEGLVYTVTAIDRMAFEKCYDLTAVSIPATVVSIGMRAFAEDTLLTSVVMAEGVQRIDMMAFFHCSMLDTVSAPVSLVRIGATAFEGTAYYDNPANWNADSTLMLGQWVLKQSNRVAGTVRVHEGVLGIANNAFIYCYDVNKVDLPSTLRYLGEGVFKECHGLDTVRLCSEVPPARYDDSFDGVDPLPVVAVPCSTMAAYLLNPNWSLHSIVEVPCPDYPYPLPPIPVEPLAVDDVQVASPTVAVMPDGTLIAEGVSGQSLEVYDMMGRRVAHVECAAMTERLRLSLPGVYVLRTSTGAGIKVCYQR